MTSRCFRDGEVEPRSGRARSRVVLVQATAVASGHTGYIAVQLTTGSRSRSSTVYCCNWFGAVYAYTYRVTCL